MRTLRTLALSLILAGCGDRQPTPAQREAIREELREELRQGLTESLPTEDLQHAKQQAQEVREANDIMARALTLWQSPPASFSDTDRSRWRMLVVTNLNREYDRRKAADGTIAAARWLKVELVDPPPADVLKRWGVLPTDVPK